MSELFSRDLVSAKAQHQRKAMGAAAAEVVVAPRPPSAKRRSTTLKFLFELEKPGSVLPAGTAKLPPPSPEPEVKRERLVEVLGA